MGVGCGAVGARVVFVLVLVSLLSPEPNEPIKMFVVEEFTSLEKCQVAKEELRAPEGTLLLCLEER